MAIKFGSRPVWIEPSWFAHFMTEWTETKGERGIGFHSVGVTTIRRRRLPQFYFLQLHQINHLLQLCKHLLLRLPSQQVTSSSQCRRRRCLTTTATTTAIRCNKHQLTQLSLPGHILSQLLLIQALQQLEIMKHISLFQFRA